MCELGSWFPRTSVAFTEFSGKLLFTHRFKISLSHYSTSGFPQVSYFPASLLLFSSFFLPLLCAGQNETENETSSLILWAEKGSVRMILTGAAGACEFSPKQVLLVKNHMGTGVL